MENAESKVWQDARMMIQKPFKNRGPVGRAAALHRALHRAAAVLMLAAAFGLISVNPVTASAPGCPDCQYRRAITIAPANLGSHCGTDISGFPVLVEIDNAIYLRSADNGGKVGNSSGYDIAFTDAAGTPLNHEVEIYKPDTGTLVAWVKVPALSVSAGTVIYMYYGDTAVSAPTQRPADVWDADYKAVYHLNQAPSGAVGDILDSTANANHAQSVTMAAGDRTDGRIGDALDFDGVDDHIRLGNPLDGAEAVTVSAWVKHDTLPATVQRYVTVGSEVAVIRHNGPGGPGELHFYAKKIDNASVHLRVDDALTVGDWYYVVGTFDETAQNLYLNGVKIASATPGKKLKASSTSYITSGGETMDGIIDEVRISRVPRDVCWIETEYNNQSSPSAFHSIGDEEFVGTPPVTTYTITASAGANGSIDPAGEVEVDEGESRLFFLEAADGYEVDQVAIDGGALQDWATAQYLFSDVRADHSIAVTFKVETSGAPSVDDELPPGCSENISTDYSAGFDQANLNLVNCVIDENGYVTLNTGNMALDPENILLPFRQQVAVTFMHEGGNNTASDFGWMLATENPDASPDPHRIVYQNINDNNDNGVLDVSSSSTIDRFDDRNGDGVVNVLDNREILGTFDAGTELIFFLKVDDDEYREDAYDSTTDTYVTDYADENETVYHYTKTAWNQSKFTSRETKTHPELSCERDWGDPFEKTYYLGRPRSDDPKCWREDGWMDTSALDRIAGPLGLSFGVDDTAKLSINWDERWPAVMVGAPANNLNAWVMGFEDLVGGGDADHNDLIFIVERETGGTAQLKSTAAISPTDPNANIQGVTLGVFDFMPDGACAGLTNITYFLSIDDGVNWVEVEAWDEVYNFSLVGGQKIVGAPVANWLPGTPAYTYRTRRVDFTALGLSGKKLVWRAELRSQKEGCEPKIMDMLLDLTVGNPGYIARSSPMVLANVMYSASMETPAGDWTSGELRGHLKTTRIYDPTDPSETSSQDLWDAGDVLKNEMAPGDRTIYIPNVTTFAVDAGNAEQLAVGDGATTVFSGRLAHYPVLATTVRLSDTRETFIDRHTDKLYGTLGGQGWINRFTGEYRVDFTTPPNANQPIKATYSYFSYTPGSMRAFVENNVLAAELGLDNSVVIPSGYVYDFDQDQDFDTADVNWLINWTRGYRDGNAKLIEKEWNLGAIDHSVPAVATPPAPGPWYYGTAFPENKQETDNDRQGFRAFQEAHASRRTVVYAGARDGMLHAFDTGIFRWGDNPCTDAGENRGFFQWKDPNDPNGCLDSCSIDCQPDYGSGEELWAFIPANLLPRLKNNLIHADDKAYVDASPALADVYVNGAWRTVLLSAEGNGGDTIYCLDVTDPDAPLFMWEFADPDLFRSRSSPAVAQIGRIYHDGTAKWAAFFVSGKTYDDTLYPSIFVIDIANGSLMEKVELDAVPAGAGGVLSGQPAIVDSDGNGYLDRLYIGSDKGLLYKINIPDSPDAVNFGLGHCVINTDFSDSNDNFVPEKWHYQPIYGSPTVVSSNSVDVAGNMTFDIQIFFGTGDSPYYDEDINFADTRYFFYAYRDTNLKGECDAAGVSLNWFFELPEGHRIYASAFAAAGNIYFGTSTGETEDPCDLSANQDAGFDANAGKLYAFDMDNPADGPILARTVGNVLAAPVVEDRHIYVQTVSGDVDSFGAGEYNNSTRQGGIPRIGTAWWREMF